MIKHYVDVFLEKYHTARGLRMLQRGNYYNAKLHFEKSLLIKDSSTNYFYYSIALISLYEHKKAITFLEKIIDSHTEDILIATTLAECYLVVREWDKAEELIAFLMAKFPDKQIVKKLYDINSDSVHREKYAESKEYFFKAMDLFNKKDSDAAFATIKNAIDLDDTNSSFHYMAGIIQLQGKKNKKEIEIHLEKAILLSPNNENYKKQLQFIKTKYKG